MGIEAPDESRHIEEVATVRGGLTELIEPIPIALWSDADHGGVAYPKAGSGSESSRVWEVER